MYAVTGASGHLGRLVVAKLVETVGAGQVVALAREPAKLSGEAAKGVTCRAFDYDNPASLVSALEGVDRLLLISSSEVGKRETQHRAVIDAAKSAGVAFIAYTSILDADDSPLGLADEHRITEAAIRESGLLYAFLRHGWYTENYTVSASAEVEHGAVIGSTGDGLISAAARADYAAADVAVLTNPPSDGAVYELAGDNAFTLAGYAAVLAEVSGKPVSYVHMDEASYRSALETIGLPGPFAAMLAESSATASGGALHDDSRTLSGLIGRPTTPMIDTVREALAVAH